MWSILKREVKNYMKKPLLWLGTAICVLVIYQNVSPYLDIHYLEEGEIIVNDYPETYRNGDVFDREWAAARNVGRTDTGKPDFRIRNGQCRGAVCH